MSSVYGASENCLKGLTNRMDAHDFNYINPSTRKKLFILSLDSQSDRRSLFIIIVIQHLKLQNNNGIHLDAWYVKLLLLIWIILSSSVFYIFVALVPFAVWSW